MSDLNIEMTGHAWVEFIGDRTVGNVLMETRTYERLAYERGHLRTLRMRGWRGLVRHRIAAAHKSIYGLMSIEPVAGDWRTVY